MKPENIAPQRGRFHLAMAASIVVGAFLLLADRQGFLFGLLPFALVVVCLALYVLLHRDAQNQRPDQNPRH